MCNYMHADDTACELEQELLTLAMYNFYIAAGFMKIILAVSF